MVVVFDDEDEGPFDLPWAHPGIAGIKDPGAEPGQPAGHSAASSSQVPDEHTPEEARTGSVEESNQSRARAEGAREEVAGMGSYRSSRARGGLFDPGKLSPLHSQSGSFEGPMLSHSGTQGLADKEVEGP